METGMTDKQFEGFLREVIANLEKAEQSNDCKAEVKEIIKRLRETLNS